MDRQPTPQQAARMLYNQPRASVLDFAPRPPSQARAVDPTMRQKLYELVAEHLGKAAAHTLVGENIGAADFIPGLGTAMQAQEGLDAIRQGSAMANNDMPAAGYINTLGGVLGVLPGAAAVVKGAKPVAKALAPKAEEMMRNGLESYMAKTGMQQNILPPKQYIGRHLDDLPLTVDMGGGRMEPFSTDQRLVDIAGQYMADKGLPYREMTKYAPVDVQRAGALAKAFSEMKHDPADPKVAKAYKALMKETQDQYEALLKAGYNFDFIRGADPYGNPRNAINDLIENKHMSVFPSTSGFGSSEADITGNPLLSVSDLKIGDDPNTTYNDLFRAVHDAFGHAQHGVGFRARGEENAFQSHARMYSPDAIPAATSETRGQNSWVNYGPFGEQNRTASPVDTVYADQKTGIMPDWTWQQGVGD